MEAFGACLDSEATLAKINADASEAKRLGATGTPAVFIGIVRSDGGVDLLRQIRGAQPAQTFVVEGRRDGGAAPEVTKLTHG